MAGRRQEVTSNRCPQKLPFCPFCSIHALCLSRQQSYGGAIPLPTPTALPKQSRNQFSNHTLIPISHTLDPVIFRKPHLAPCEALEAPCEAVTLVFLHE